MPFQNVSLPEKVNITITAFVRYQVGRSVGYFISNGLAYRDGFGNIRYLNMCECRL